MVRISSRKMSKDDAETIDKWIFVLLSVNDYEGITGRVRMTKEFFLIAKENVPELWNVVEFYPYHFGPYSTRLAVRMNTLSQEGLIGVRPSNSDWCYHLTKKGKEISIQYLNLIDNETLEIISQIKRSHKRKGLRSFLKEIYERYPEFSSRSIIIPQLQERKEISLRDKTQVDDRPGFVAFREVEDEGILLKKEAARRFLECLKEI